MSQTLNSSGPASKCMTPLASALMLLGLGGTLAADARAQSTERVSISSAEVQDNTGASGAAYITPDGRFVVFSSTADNLVPADTNGVMDVFVRDRVAGTTSRISIPDPSMGQAQANSSCYLGRAGLRFCSDDGRHVVFVSAANNLVPGDTNGDPPYHIPGTDIFVRDRDVDGNGVFDEAGVGMTKTVRVSVKTNGSQYTEFPIGVGTYGGGCSNPSISANGQYVVFESEDDNLTTGNDQGTIGSNIYYHDRDNDGLGEWDQIGPVCIIIFQNGCITAEGSTTELVSKVRCCSGQQFDGYCYDPVISGNGRYVAFVTQSQYLDYNLLNDLDNNQRADVYVRDMWSSSRMVRVSLDSDENQNTDSGSGHPTVSHDGRFIAFTSASSQLVNGDTNGVTDVFLRDRDHDVNGTLDELGFSGIVDRSTTRRVSLGAANFIIGNPNRNVQLTGASEQPFISPDGRYVAFVTSDDSVLCTLFNCSDGNGFRDVYLRDTTEGAEWTYWASIGAAGGAGNGHSTFPSLSWDGTKVAFASVASNLFSPDANGAGSDIYVRVLSGSPSVTGAVSRKTHGAAGDLDIDLPLSGAAGVEPRLNGPTQIVISFDEDIYAADGSASNNEVGVSAGAVSSVSTLGNTLIANLTGVPDKACLTLSLFGLVDVEGNPLAFSNQVRVVSLIGDANGNGTVNTADMAFVKSRIGMNPAQPGNARVDVNLSGTINTTDMALVKSRITNSAACP